MANVMDPREEWFWDEKIVESYESWYEGKGKRSDRLEKRVLGELLRSFGPIESLLEVGCGTAHFTRYFESLGLRCTGYDLSPVMLAVARKLWRGHLIRGDSARLPFSDNSFDIIGFVTCLEFMPKPVEVLREAGRIGRRGIIIGLMNRYGISTVRRTVQVWFGRSPFYRHAHFYSLEEIRKLLRLAIHGDVFIDWRATVLPRVLGDRVTRLPIGDFLALSVMFNKKT